MNISFEHIEEELLKFESLLKQQYLSIKNDSYLDAIILDAVKIFEYYKNKTSISLTEERELFRNVIGIYDLVSKLCRVYGKKDFDQFTNHLEILSKSKDKLSQNIKSEVIEQDSNNIFELLIGSAVLEVTDNLFMENPKDSQKTKNPDIIFNYHGKKIGIACKVMHSKNPKTLVERFQEGAKQITRSGVDGGLVVINLKNTNFCLN